MIAIEKRDKSDNVIYNTVYYTTHTNTDNNNYQQLDIYSMLLLLHVVITPCCYSFQY